MIEEEIAVETVSPKTRSAGNGGGGVTHEKGADNALPKKRFGKKGRITLGVVLTVVVVAVIGLFVWHEQPSFCNAVCHIPMDPYLPTYESDPGQPALDKWGNEVSDASGMLAATHRAKANVDCMGCHVPTVGEQVSEGMSWISGNYEVYSMGSYANVLQERTLSELTGARGIPGEGFCLNSSCHNMKREHLERLTVDMEFNPHVSQHETMDCDTCHKAHRQSVMYCTKCHVEAESSIPEGWLSYKDAQALDTVQ